MGLGGPGTLSTTATWFKMMRHLEERHVADTASNQNIPFTSSILPCSHIQISEVQAGFLSGQVSRVLSANVLALLFWAWHKVRKASVICYTLDGYWQPKIYQWLFKATSHKSSSIMHNIQIFRKHSPKYRHVNQHHMLNAEINKRKPQ